MYTKNLIKTSFSLIKKNSKHKKVFFKTRKNFIIEKNLPSFKKNQINVAFDLNWNRAITAIFDKSNSISSSIPELFATNMLALFFFKKVLQLNNKVYLPFLLKNYFTYTLNTLVILGFENLKYNVNTKIRNETIQPMLNFFIFDKITYITSLIYFNTLLLKNKIELNTKITYLIVNTEWNWLSNNKCNLSRSLKSSSLLKKKLKSFIYNINKHINLLNINLGTNNFIQNQLNLNTSIQLYIQNQSSILQYQECIENPLTTPKNVIYFLMKIEEKILHLNTFSGFTDQKKKLINFYNFLTHCILTKNETILQSKYILGKLNSFSKLKNIDLDNFVEKTTKNLVLKNYKNIQYSKIITSLKNKTGNKTFWNNRILLPKLAIKKKEKQSRLTLTKPFLNKKLELINYYTKANLNTKILDTVLNKKTKIFYINAFALTKFGFLLEKQKTSMQNLSINPTKFLANLDREIISKYKYIGVYIKDIIRVAFISLFLKKPAFLAKFIAFQLNILPKNRRETSFIRFIIKLIKTFAAEREEIWGLRLKFKGRVNRWRRTKIILGQRGILPLHTINNRIEYGTAQAINRKGAVGVHVWIWYDPMFKPLLKETYTKYFQYSNYINTKIND